MKVSVSLVTFNHERFVAQALDGILMQRTDFDFEVIVGDDCSTDGTRRVIEEYRARFPDRIRTVNPERNLGDAGRPMFVETVRHCTGDYIAMLDGDDYWTAPDKLQRQADYLDAHSECSLCYHDAEIVSEGPELPRWEFIAPQVPDFLTAEDLLWSCPIPACSGMIRREVVEDFPAWFFSGPWADIALYLMAAEHGKIGLIREKMGAYRVHPGSVWSSLDEEAQVRSALAVLDGIEEATGTRHARTIARCRSRRHVQLAKVFAKRGEWARGVGEMLRAARLDPALGNLGYRNLLGALARHGLR